MQQDLTIDLQAEAFSEQAEQLDSGEVFVWQWSTTTRTTTTTTTKATTTTTTTLLTSSLHFLALSLSLCSHQVKFRHTSMWAPGCKYWALKRFHLEVTRYIYHYVISPQVTNNSRTILNNKIQAEQAGNGSFSMLSVHFLYWIHESSDSPTYDFSTRCWSSLWINCTVEDDSPYFGDSLLLLWVKGDGARRKRSEWSMLPFSKKTHHEHQEKV